MEVPEAPTMASGIVDVEKPRAPLRRLLSVPSTPGNDRTPIAREIQAAIPNTEVRLNTAIQHIWLLWT